MFEFPKSFIDSGNRCKNAPPRRAPVEKATNDKIIFSNLSSFKNKNSTVIKDETPIRKVNKII